MDRHRAKPQIFPVFRVFVQRGYDYRRDQYERDCLTESVYEVGLQKSVPAQIRQLILCISNSKNLRICGGDDFCTTTLETFLWDNTAKEAASGVVEINK